MGDSGIDREDVLASVAARRELGETYDREVVDAFLGRIEQAIDARVEQRLAQRQAAPVVTSRRSSPGWSLALALTSVTLAIPIVSSTAALVQGPGAVVAIAFEMAGLVGINFAFARNR